MNPIHDESVPADHKSVIPEDRYTIMNHSAHYPAILQPYTLSLDANRLLYIYDLTKSVVILLRTFDCFHTTIIGVYFP